MSDNDPIERAAREAYAAWKDHYMHDTLWNELSPQAQVVWLNIAHAAIAAHKRETTR